MKMELAFPGPRSPETEEFNPENKGISLVSSWKCFRKYFLCGYALKLRLQLLPVVVGKRKENYKFTPFTGNLLVFWFCVPCQFLYFAFCWVPSVYGALLDSKLHEEFLKSTQLNKPLSQLGWKQILNKCP